MTPFAPIRAPAAVLSIRPLILPLILLGAPPALSDPGLSDPGLPDGAAAGCWRPGGAPALFSWVATPGIACRDKAGGARNAGPGAHPMFPLPPPARAATPRPETPGQPPAPAGFTFSGSAHFGVAVAF